MLGIAASGGALAVCLSSLALSFRPTLGYLMGAALTLNFLSGFMLNAPLSGAVGAAGGLAGAASAQGTATATGTLVSVARDPVGALLAAAKGLQGSALDPGNVWVLGAVVAAAVVVLLARLPDPDAQA